MPFFSIIIPTYNRLGLLKETIASVQSQECKDFELIIVDDGSTDGTDGYIDQLGAKIIRQHNRGPGAARNTAAKDAAGEYLVFLDSDDLLYPWSLSTYREVIKTHGAMFLAGSVIEFDGPPPTAKQEPIAVERFDNFLLTSENPQSVTGGNLIIRKDLFMSVGGFDETLRIGEDTDFYIRVGLRAQFFRVASPFTIAYRVHSGSTWRNPKPLAAAVLTLLDRETSGSYPGGMQLRRNRISLLTRAARPASLACLHSGHRAEALQLYVRSLGMNLRLGRIKYLAGFWARYLMG